MAMSPPPERHGALDVVTLNLRFGLHVARARRLFERVGELGRAGIVLLQEMDEEGTAALASSLGMGWAYHSATVHRRTGRDFGNAVLSRWPIVRHRKVLLPHASLRDGSRRAATCATVVTPLGPLEVCSLHVATPLELMPAARREQVRAALAEVRGATPAVLGGDLNGHRLGALAEADAFEWTTRDVGSTVACFSFDHIFARGLRASRVGRVKDTQGATDHAAVWATLVPPGGVAPP
jgi:endonuclease/exonuclease/phosphatase family metal-dependent hydrolase